MMLPWVAMISIVWVMEAELKTAGILEVREVVSKRRRCNLIEGGIHFESEKLEPGLHGEGQLNATEDIEVLCDADLGVGD